MATITFSVKSGGKYSLTDPSVWVGGTLPGTADTVAFTGQKNAVDLTGSLTVGVVDILNANVALDGTITTTAASGDELLVSQNGTLTINSTGTLTGPSIVQIGTGTSTAGTVEVYGSLGASDVDLTGRNALLEVAPGSVVSGELIIAGGNLLSVVGTGTNVAGTATLTGGVSLVSSTNILATTNTDIMLTGPISGAGALAINGVVAGPSGNVVFPGRVELDGASNFTGGVQLNLGTLVVGNGRALGTGTLTVNSGTVLFTANETVTNALHISPTVDATIEVAHGQTVTLAPTTAPLFNGYVTIGSGLNDGTLVFDLAHGNGNAAAGFVIEAGTVRLTPGTNSPLFAGSADTSYIQAGATYDLNGVSDAAPYLFSNGVITDTGAVALFAMYGGVIAGTISGVVQFNVPAGYSAVLLGTNEATQATTIGTGGVLQVGSGTVDGTIDGDVNDLGLLVIAGSNENLPGVISGHGNLFAEGGGTLSLTNNVAITGVTIATGALQVGAGGTLGALNAAVSIGALTTLIFDRSDTITFGNTISGAGGLVQMGPGTLKLTAANSFTGGATVGAGTLELGQGAAGSGIITLAPSADTALVFDIGYGTVTNTIDGFHSGDKIVAGLTFNAADTLSYANGTLSILQPGIGTLSTLLLSMPSYTTSSDFTASRDSATGQLAITTDIPCFAAGTRIATARGEVPVEALQVGDRVCRAADPRRTLKVKWIGRRRVDCFRHPRPHDVLPVLVAAHAFAPGVPARDVVLSPDHAVFAGGVLIPVRYLLNGATIRQEQADTIEYFHVELTRHDVLLAEGLPCESYLDTGNRTAFAASGAVVEAHPDFARRIWDRRGCAPLVMAGETLAAVRRTLIDRLPGCGFTVTEDAALELLADGAVQEPQRDGGWWVVALPPDARRLAVRSRTMCPADLDSTSDDRRPVGVALRELRIDGVRVKLNDRRLAEGWHAPEAALRWSAGAGMIDVAGAAVVELRFGAWPRYLVAEEAARRAA
jgi:autotransporter-associated beta strand protein